MTPTLLVTLALAGVVACLLAGVLVVLVRDRAHARAVLEQARAEAEELRRRLDALSVEVAAARHAAPVEEYVITHLGESDAAGPDTVAAPAAEPAGRVDGRLFADLVVRETVVKAAALGHGVRRAMAAETRNRIRFEMKQEVKARRKERRAETRRVRRALQDQRRAAAT